MQAQAIKVAQKPAYEPVETAFTYLMKQQRMKLGLSAKKVADEVGMSRSYILDVEKGKFDTSMEIGFAICTVLDIKIEMFIDHIFQVKQHRLLTDIEHSCKEWDIEIPLQFRREQHV